MLQPTPETAVDLLPESPFTAAEALERGVSRWMLATLLDRRQVRQPLRGAYVRSDVPDSIAARAAAFACVAPEHAVAVDRTAAWLWGVDILQPHELDQVPPLEVFVLRGRTRVRRPQLVSGERDLREDDVVTVGSIRLTTPLRTSLDLACRLSRHEAMASMNEFARRHGVGARELARLLPRYRRRRGVVQARALVPLVDGRIESTGESWVWLVLHDHDVRAPQPQHWVWVDGVPTYRLDFAYPELKICIEYDGEAFHTSAAQRDADHRRRTWLRDHGWLVIVVTKHQLKGAALDAWLTELRRALAERSRG